jgi:hypothetical protein
MVNSLTPSSISERADPVLLLPPVVNCCHCPNRLLLGVERSIFITIFTIPNINTSSTSIFDIIPLIVCGKSNP